MTEANDPARAAWPEEIRQIARNVDADDLRGGLRIAIDNTELMLTLLRYGQIEHVVAMLEAMLATNRAALAATERRLTSQMKPPPISDAIGTPTPAPDHASRIAMERLAARRPRLTSTAA